MKIRRSLEAEPTREEREEMEMDARAEGYVERIAAMTSPMSDSIESWLWGRELSQRLIALEQALPTKTRREQMEADARSEAEEAAQATAIEQQAHGFRRINALLLMGGERDPRKFASDVKVICWEVVNQDPRAA